MLARGGISDIPLGAVYHAALETATQRGHSYVLIHQFYEDRSATTALTLYEGCVRM